jgi:glycosyltransferase domain-containing protein
MLTIVVPTYNRPFELARLLAFLRLNCDDMAILVLDSSNTEAAVKNAETCSVTPNTVHRRYNEDVRFYDKLADGVQLHVRSPTVCLCADDDLIVPEIIRSAAALLMTEPTTAVAHGYYAQFFPGDEASSLTSIISTKGDVRGESPLQRAAQGFLSYEATIYGVHRTPLMSTILAEAAKAPNLFAAELSTMVLAMAAGDMRRRTHFSHARSIAPSVGAKRWHPAELLASEPDELLRAIAFLRDRLTALHPSAPRWDLRAFDLAVVAYLSDYVTPNSARRVARLALDGGSVEELREAGWHEFAAMLQPAPLKAKLRNSAVARRLARQLEDRPVLRQKLATLARVGLRRSKRMSVAATKSRSRTVVLEPAFQRSLAELAMSPKGPEVKALSEAVASFAALSPTDRTQKQE